MFTISSPSSRTIIADFQIGADCYVGQLVATDTNGYGEVIPCPQAAAGPDTAARIVGVVVGVNGENVYDSTYKANKSDYVTSQADQLANEWNGPGSVKVAVLTPGTLIKAPINLTTYGTALTVLDETTGDAAGDDMTHANDTITAPVSLLSTLYCRTGANRGVSRIITAGGTGDQDETICFPYDIAIGDKFVAASMKKGYCNFDIISTANAFEGLWATNYFEGYCHQVNLEEAGKEYAIVSIAGKHLAA